MKDIFVGTSSGAGPGTEFSDPIEAVQAAVDELQSKNVTRIVALTHIGYDKDIELAEKTTGVDLVRLYLDLFPRHCSIGIVTQIIGGHSHTLVGSMEGAAGPYPTLAKNMDGDEVFVVTVCWSFVHSGK